MPCSHRGSAAIVTQDEVAASAWPPFRTLKVHASKSLFTKSQFWHAVHHMPELLGSAVHDMASHLLWEIQEINGLGGRLPFVAVTSSSVVILRMAGTSLTLSAGQETPAGKSLALLNVLTSAYGGIHSATEITGVLSAAPEKQTRPWTTIPANEHSTHHQEQMCACPGNILCKHVFFKSARMGSCRSPCRSRVQHARAARMRAQ